MQRLRSASLWIALGVLMALGQAPFGLWPLSFAAMVIAILIAAKAASVRSSLGAGFWVGFGYGALALHWIVEPFLVDAARYGWMAPFGLIGMAAGFGLFWGGGLAIAHGLSGRASVWSVAAGLGLAETARSILFTGFPWALLSHIWIGTPIYGLAAYLGPIGLSLLSVICAALLARAIGNRAPVTAGIPGIVAALSLTIGMATLRTETDDGPHVLRLVQPNAPQHLKWHPDWTDTFFDRQLDLSGRPGDPDLVIWPEVAVTFRLDDPNAPFGTIVDAAGGKPVILGGLRVSQSRVYNSMLVLGSDGRPDSLYDKHHLVPFGEYAPGGDLARRIGLRGLAEQLNFGFSAGPGPQIVTLPNGLSVLPMICYEAIFPHELRRAGSQRPDILLHLTNDAWFGDWAGPAQHLAQARARAIEFGLPVVRVANTGVSGLIDANGRLGAHLPLGTSGHLDVTVPGAKSATLYWRFGDSPAIIGLIVLLATLVLGRNRNRIDPKPPRQ